MTRIDFQTLESSYNMPCGIMRETWFITKSYRNNPIRREIYKAQDGSVVAIRDSGVGVDTSLYMEMRFFDFYQDEPELQGILYDQGITDYSLIKLFRMEE